MNSRFVKSILYCISTVERLFGKAWKEEFVVLYEDSSVIWFRDRDRLDPEGGLFLRDAPEMLAAGQWVSRVPNKPEMPNGCDYKLSIAMGSRHREKVHWFLCKSESELIDWMSAISKTVRYFKPTLFTRSATAGQQVIRVVLLLVVDTKMRKLA